MYVLDTGVRATHVDFATTTVVRAPRTSPPPPEGRTSVWVVPVRHGAVDPVTPQVGGPSFVDTDALPSTVDCHGHGTHVASMIAGASFGAAKVRARRLVQEFVSGVWSVGCGVWGVGCGCRVWVWV